MRHYAQQLKPLMEPLIEKGEARLSLEGGYFERAFYRGILRAWPKTSHYEARRR